MNNPHPYTWGEARDAVNAAKSLQADAEKAARAAYRDFAEKRQAYQVALAVEITRLRSEGMAATTCGDVARGETKVAQLRFERDVQEGVVESAKAALWRLSADRRALEQLVQWSMRADFANDGAPA